MPGFGETDDAGGDSDDGGDDDDDDLPDLEPANN